MKLSADPLQNHILEMASAGSQAFSDDLVEQILQAIIPLRKRNAPDYVLIQAAREALVRAGPELARLHRDARLAAAVTGAASAGDKLPPDRKPPGPPLFGDWEWDGDKTWLPLVDEAVQYLQDRHLLLRDEWHDLKSRAEDEGRDLAKLAGREAEAKITQALITSVRDGGTLKAFKEDVGEAVEASGMGAGTLEGVFRTGTAVAYNAGYEALMDEPIIGEMLPFDENLDIEDSRETDLCWTISRSGLDGTAIFLRDDPVWQIFKCPRHWGCRCARNGLSVAEAARRGIKYAQHWLEIGHRPSQGGFVAWPNVQLPKGWTPGGRI